MVYFGTEFTETIWFAPEDNGEDMHCISLCKAADKFFVSIDDDASQMWLFKLDAVSSYEIAKFVITDVLLNACCLSNLKSALDEAFMENLADVLVDDEHGCCGNHCERCDHRECLN